MEYMKIIPLNEGIFTVTKDKIFTEIQRDEVETTDPQLLKMGVCPFLIVLPNNELVLFDAGTGYIKNDQIVLLQRIKEAGYQPEQVSKVILSHLHKDHIEGLGQIKGDKIEPNFPNAQIYYQQRELDYALQQTESYSFDQEYLKLFAKLPNLIAMNDDEGNIGEYITYLVTGGHSPFHQVFWIKEENETAFYGADNLPQKSYLKFHIAYKSDYDGKKAKELRLLWEEQAKAENWTILFYHEFSRNITTL